jgi:hypothetical protein
VDENGDEAHGFCYVDATTAPPIGDPAAVAPWCPDTARRALVFTRLDAIAASPDSQSLTLVCSHEVCVAP